jgi:hypothetical protein
MRAAKARKERLDIKIGPKESMGIMMNAAQGIKRADAMASIDSGRIAGGHS